MAEKGGCVELRSQLKILVPLDGSRLAESALTAVAYLGSAYRVQVLLLHAIERHTPARVHGERHLREPHEAAAYLEAAAERLKQAGVQVTWHVHPNEVGDVAQSIIEHAGEMGPDLIVMCTHGSGGLRGLLFGSIAQQTLRNGAWPILLVPPQLTEHPIPFKLERLVLPWEQRHPQDKALHEAQQLCEAFHAVLHLAVVVPTTGRLASEESVAGRFMPLATRAMLDMAEEEALRRVQELKQICGADDLKVAAEVLRGEPVAELTAYTERIGADLIIMASHGQVGLGALLAGSVAPRVIGHVSCSVMLVRSE